MDHAGLVLHDQAAGLGNVPPEIAAEFCPGPRGCPGVPPRGHGPWVLTFHRHPWWNGLGRASLPSPPGKRDKRASLCVLSARLVVVFVRASPLFPKELQFVIIGVRDLKNTDMQF